MLSSVSSIKSYENISTTNLKNVKKDEKVSSLQEEKKMSNTSKLIIGSVALAAVVAGGILFHNKVKVNDLKKLAEKNKKLDDIFNNFKIDFNPTNKNKNYVSENLTLKEIFDKYMHSCDMTGKKIYHGTDKKAAEIIKTKGMKTGPTGNLTGNWRGSYFVEELKVAENYAKDKVGIIGMRGKKTQGVVINASLPNATKFAEFRNVDGNHIIDFIHRILENKKLETVLDSKNLSTSDLKRFLQEYIESKGYAGVRSHDIHTGITPILFKNSLLKIDEIINV